MIEILGLHTTDFIGPVSIQARLVGEPGPSAGARSRDRLGSEAADHRSSSTELPSCSEVFFLFNLCCLATNYQPIATQHNPVLAQ